MAEAKTNIGFDGISGRMGRWSLRHVGEKTFIARRPKRTGVQTPAQGEVRDTFRLAAAYATAAYQEPALLAEYRAISVDRGVKPRPLMIADFFHPPVVKKIILNKYTGAPGTPIVVEAFDDVGVTGVTVELRAADNSPLEQAAAMLVMGQWVCQPTGSYPKGTPVTIIATAMDRPGHTGTLTATWM